VKLIDYINNPSLLDRTSLDALRQLLTDYPFHQPARLLYVANLYQLHDPRFGEELRRASILVPDRKTLFQLIEGQHYDIQASISEEERQRIMTEDDDRTLSLIDSFLSTQVETEEADAAPTQPHNVPTVADVTSDYAAFLAQQDDLHDAETADSQPRIALKGASYIDNFINETAGRQRYEINSDAEATPLYDPLHDIGAQDDNDSEIYNQQVVDLLIKQQKYEQAKEILHRICLNNPEKTSIFASQIQLLEVILGQHKAQNT